MLNGKDNEHQKSPEVGRVLEANMVREGFMDRAEFGQDPRGDASSRQVWRMRIPSSGAQPGKEGFKMRSQVCATRIHMIICG